MDDIHEQWELMKYLKTQEDVYEQNMLAKFGDLRLEKKQLDDMFNMGDKYGATIEKF